MNNNGITGFISAFKMICFSSEGNDSSFPAVQVHEFNSAPTLYTIDIPLH